jgi:hypothetical protein
MWGKMSYVPLVLASTLYVSRQLCSGQNVTWSEANNLYKIQLIIFTLLCYKYSITPFCTVVPNSIRVALVRSHLRTCSLVLLAPFFFSLNIENSGFALLRLDLFYSGKLVKEFPLLDFPAIDILVARRSMCGRLLL